ncbi:MAG: hypothetical protein CMG07_00750 [Candidatus Marinimicrobia bacterium]|nr:hypothetical protein [Candidatus Neomarinimicrobiota bacterium]|tara:strand:+ start:441 stop:626 length:186 start_codon:yes stop_codon:yes gene_type:complete
MVFSQYKNVLIGICLIGFAMGSIVGAYIIYITNNYYWIYLSSPVLAIGSAFVIFGVLKKNK